MKDSSVSTSKYPKTWSSTQRPPSAIVGSLCHSSSALALLVDVCAIDLSQLLREEPGVSDVQHDSVNFPVEEGAGEVAEGEGGVEREADFARAGTEVEDGWWERLAHDLAFGGGVFYLDDAKGEVGERILPDHVGELGGERGEESEGVEDDGCG